MSMTGVDMTIKEMLTAGIKRNELLEKERTEHMNEKTQDIEPEESRPIDTDYTKEIVCPCCGYEFGDSWEYNEGGSSQEIECVECGEGFLLDIDFDVTYSTRKKG